MANRIGCTHAAYRKWEAGTVPRGDWMVRILALCPDEQTRNNFFVDIAETGSKISSNPTRRRDLRYEELPVKIPNRKGRA